MIINYRLYPALTEDNPKGWEQALTITENMPELAEKICTALLREMAVKGQMYVKQHIVAQDLPWTPLNKKYARSKQVEGHSPLIYMRTGYFYENITSVIQKRKIFVGLRKGLRHPETKTALVDIANLMEYGGYVGKYYVPSRPLFRPSMQDVIREILMKHPPNEMMLQAIKHYIK